MTCTPTKSGRAREERRRRRRERGAHSNTQDDGSRSAPSLSSLSGSDSRTACPATDRRMLLVSPDRSTPATPRPSAAMREFQHPPQLLRSSLCLAAPAPQFPVDARGALPQLGQKSMRMTTRRGVGRLTWAKPASAKTPSVPTWSSSAITPFAVIG
jgi:hypothetical protein